MYIRAFRAFRWPAVCLRRDGNIPRGIKAIATIFPAGAVLVYKELLTILNYFHWRLFPAISPRLSTMGTCVAVIGCINGNSRQYFCRK